MNESSSHSTSISSSFAMISLWIHLMSSPMTRSSRNSTLPWFSFHIILSDTIKDKQLRYIVFLQMQVTFYFSIFVVCMRKLLQNCGESNWFCEKLSLINFHNSDCSCWHSTFCFTFKIWSGDNKYLIQNTCLIS